MTITAKFSNGHIDTYKGTRPVKAAWMIVDKKTGKVLSSGHSLDRTKAVKTSLGNLKYQGSDVLASDHPLYFVMGPDWRWNSRQRAAARKHNDDRLQLIKELTIIEVIDL